MNDVNTWLRTVPIRVSIDFAIGCRFASAEFCLKRSELLRGKRVLELGSGIGMTGMMIAACCGASEVVLSDYAPRQEDGLGFIEGVRVISPVWGIVSQASLSMSDF